MSSGQNNHNFQNIYIVPQYTFSYTNKSVKTMSLEATVEPQKKEENPLKRLFKEWGIKQSNANPIDFLKYENMVPTKTYNKNDEWRLYFIKKKDRRTIRGNPAANIICSSYNSPEKAGNDLIKLYEELVQTQNVGIVMHNTKENKTYVGYLNPMQNPASYHSLKVQIPDFFSLEKVA